MIFFLTSNTESTSRFKILDLDMNLPDHYPVTVSVMCSETPHCKNKDGVSNNLPRSEFYLRWDKADISSYYFHTEHHLQSVLQNLDYALELPETIPLNVIDNLCN